MRINWEDAVNQSGYSVRYALSQEYLWGGTPDVMHVEGTDLFYDILFTSWTCCSQGGGFSYTRTLVSESGENFGLLNKINLVF